MINNKKSILQLLIDKIDSFDNKKFIKLSTLNILMYIIGFKVFMTGLSLNKAITYIIISTIISLLITKRFICKKSLYLSLSVILIVIYTLIVCLLFKHTYNTSANTTVSYITPYAMILIIAIFLYPITASWGYIFIHRKIDKQ